MERLVATCSEYTNINKYVFISCRNYIIVLEKLHDTITNESKLSDISNPLYAKYRANKLRVILIINKFEPFDVITEIQEDSIMKYETDKIVEVDDYDMDLDQVFTTGIHYFNTIEQAFYWKIIDFNPTYTGKYMCWYHNGNKRYDGE
jgi:hypothetical protein